MPTSQNRKVSTVDQEIRPLPDVPTVRTRADALKLIVDLGTNAHEHAYKVGKLLLWVRKESPELKALEGKDRGPAFKKWVDENVWFAYRTARRFMSFSQRCDNHKPPALLPYHPKEAEGGTISIPESPDQDKRRQARKALKERLSKAKEQRKVVGKLEDNDLRPKQIAKWDREVKQAEDALKAHDEKDPTQGSRIQRIWKNAHLLQQDMQKMETSEFESTVETIDKVVKLLQGLRNPNADTDFAAN